MLITGTDAHGHIGNFSRTVYHKLEEEQKNMDEMILKVKGKYYDKLVKIDATVSDDYDKADAIHDVLVSYTDAIQIIGDLAIEMPKSNVINYPLSIKALYLDKIIGVDGSDDGGYGKGREFKKLIRQCEEVSTMLETIEAEQANYVKVVEKEEQA
jgi:hypothetical protein